MCNKTMPIQSTVSLITRHLQLEVKCHLFSIAVLICTVGFCVIMNIRGYLHVQNIALHHFNSNRPTRICDKAVASFCFESKFHVLFPAWTYLPLLSGTHLLSADKQDRPVWELNANEAHVYSKRAQPYWWVHSPDHFLFIYSSSILLWSMLILSHFVLRQNILRLLLFLFFSLS